jgi:hypothetical protein
VLAWAAESSVLPCYPCCEPSSSNGVAAGSLQQSHSFLQRMRRRAHQLSRSPALLGVHMQQQRLVKHRIACRSSTM